MPCLNSLRIAVRGSSKLCNDLNMLSLTPYTEPDGVWAGIVECFCSIVLQGNKEEHQNRCPPKVRHEQRHMVPGLGHAGLAAMVHADRVCAVSCVAYTCQMCSSCGFVEQKSKNGRVFLCMPCQYPAHADRNATQNIEGAGDMQSWQTG